jgi:beta-glucanase (GH16 family)
MRKLLRAAVTAAVTATALLAGAVPAHAWTKPVPKPAPYCGATIVKTNGTAWTCTFDDDFNGSVLDSTKWTAITTAMNGQTAAGGCFVNSPNNISVANGVLSLTTRKEATPFTCKTPTSSFQTQYSSSQIATYGKFFQTYGRFEVRAKFPATTIAGLQSSLWMWPENNILTGLTGEIDIAEWYSAQADHAIPYLHYLYDTTTANLLTDVNLVSNNNCVIADTTQFHSYTVTWVSNYFQIQYDGVTCLTDYAVPLGTSPFNQPFFLALGQGLGIGKNAYVNGTTPLPATTQVDYVRAWK